MVFALQTLGISFLIPERFLLLISIQSAGEDFRKSYIVPGVICISPIQRNASSCGLAGISVILLKMIAFSIC